MQIYLVDAFTTKRFEGNPAGVVIDADALSSREMQEIARELNASETAFSRKGTNADYAVRFFTPTTEIAFCGHATVALFHTLAATGRITVTAKSRNFTESTPVGIIPVSVRLADDLIQVTMTQNVFHSADPACETADLLSALGLTASDLDQRFPTKLTKTANRHLILAVQPEALPRINYDAQKLGAILTGEDVVTAHVFAQSGPATYRARNFGPHIGIQEDPATGSAAGAFGAYLHSIGLATEREQTFNIIQGETMGRRSDITICVQSSSEQFHKVEITGTAVQSFQLTHALTNQKQT